MKLEPGQVYIGKCLTSFEPNLWFYYVLLSADGEDGVEYWTTAQFMKGYYGAQVKKFTEDEIHNLGYVGHISTLLFKEIKL